MTIRIALAQVQIPLLQLQTLVALSCKLEVRDDFRSSGFVRACVARREC